MYLRLFLHNVYWLFLHYCAIVVIVLLDHHWSFGPILLDLSIKFSTIQLYFNGTSLGAFHLTEFVKFLLLSLHNNFFLILVKIRLLKLEFDLDRLYLSMIVTIVLKLLFQHWFLLEVLLQSRNVIEHHQCLSLRFPSY